jgi:hypothetical protein
MESSHNELDIPEIWGGHPSKELSRSTVRDGVGGYWYFNSSQNWEDGNYHLV